MEIQERLDDPASRHSAFHLYANPETAALLPVWGKFVRHSINGCFGAGRGITVRNGGKNWLTGPGRVPICRREHPMTGSGMHCCHSSQLPDSAT